MSKTCRQSRANATEGAAGTVCSGSQNGPGSGLTEKIALSRNWLHQDFPSVTMGRLILVYASRRTPGTAVCAKRNETGFLHRGSNHQGVESSCRRLAAFAI